jgi:YegS/Rv2252/BmrU family lipid kinase
MKDIYLIMNPGSRSGKSRQSFNRIIQLISQSGKSFDYQTTTCLEDAFRLSRDANLAGYKTIVAIGGDGTINGVINGFFDEHGKRLSDAKFGVIYTGTSPDFNKSYNIPLDVDKAVETILKGLSVEIKVGRIAFGGPSTNTRYFVCCANIGLGAQLARKANSGIRKKLGDFGGTLTALIGLLATFKPFVLIVREDDKRDVLNRMINLSVGITPYIASGIQVPILFPSPKKEFYKMSVGNLSLSKTLPLLRRVYGGKPFQNTDYLSLANTGHLELSSPTDIEVEADGDPVGFLPCTIGFARDGLELLVAE